MTNKHLSSRPPSEAPPHSSPKPHNRPLVLFAVIFVVRVAADGDDADRRAGRVGDDDGLSGQVVLVLVVAGGAGSLF